MVSRKVLHSTSRWRFRGLVLVVVALLCGCSGSNRDRVPVHPVTGKVLVDGQPPEGATVVFHPVSSTEEMAHKPAARVQADGTFQVTTYEAHDGAPAGEYVVTVTWSAPPTPDRLGGKYSDPETSQLQVTVTEGENLLKPFELKGARQPRRAGPPQR